MRYVLTFAVILAVQSIAFGQCANGSCSTPSSGTFSARPVVGAPVRAVSTIRSHLPHPIRGFIAKHRAKCGR